jgi:hypothetical protein
MASDSKTNASDFRRNICVCFKVKYGRLRLAGILEGEKSIQKFCEEMS